MEQALTKIDSPDAGSVVDQSLQHFVTFMVGSQLFGIPDQTVQSILHLKTITHIPLSPPEVEGLVNLRGQIVSVINTRVHLGVDERSQDADRGNVKDMGITIEQNGDLYMLLVDSIGDVVGISSNDREGSVSAVDPRWREFSLDVYRLEGQLMVALDVNRFLQNILS